MRWVPLLRGFYWALLMSEEHNVVHYAKDHRSWGSGPTELVPTSVLESLGLIFVSLNFLLINERWG